MTPLAEEKAETRRLAVARRKPAHAGRSADDADLLVRVLGPDAGKVVSGYMPMRTEIDCLPALAAHVAAGQGGRACVPVIMGPAQPLQFRQWCPTSAMVPGEFGALVPEAGGWLEPDVLIVPLLAFDRRGFRLGYGGGFYDRTLERLRAIKPVRAIGFAYSAQEIGEVPIEPTDQPLDLIVTESEVIVPAGPTR